MVLDELVFYHQTAEEVPDNNPSDTTVRFPHSGHAPHAEGVDNLCGTSPLANVSANVVNKFSVCSTLEHRAQMLCCHARRRTSCCAPPGTSQMRAKRSESSETGLSGT